MSQKFSMTPMQFLREVGVDFKEKVHWLSVKTCPFCLGGDHGDVFSFAVHKEGGNFSCSRTKCGKRGTFWGLLLHYGYNPRKYIKYEDGKVKRKRFTYQSKR
jgi:hypothetical protein